MVSWRDVRDAYAVFLRCLQNSPAETEQYFKEFWGICEAIPIPSHLCSIIEAADAKKETILLDHGCGTGINVLYLYVLGYKSIVGIDLEYRIEMFRQINKFLIDQNITEKELLVSYDGANVPFDSDHFDLIYSTQVIEHLSDQDFDNYFREEHRLLKKGGIIVHEFPHRGMIFDGHLQTVLIHILPDLLLKKLLKMLGSRRHEIVGNGLYLRFYGEVRRNLLQSFTGFEDLTLNRLRQPVDLHDYEGSVPIRRMFSYCVRLPVFGALLASFVIRTIKARRA